MKNWKRLSEIQDRITNPKIFIQYGKAKESESKYAEAASAYEKARDYDAVINILINHLNDLDGGAELVRKTQGRESAKQVAQLYLQSRNFKQAIEFYLIAGLQQQAFQLAKDQNAMPYFAALIKEDASTALLLEIASYYNEKQNWLESGTHYLHALYYPQALQQFLKDPSGESINLAIQTIGESKQDALTHELIDYLMGERDGTPKDAKYIFKLYMSLGQTKEAARTAIIIAREEQGLGNYRAAHDLLFDNYRQLQKSGALIPSELDFMLMLIHSYLLVKV